MARIMLPIATMKRSLSDRALVWLFIGFVAVAACSSANPLIGDAGGSGGQGDRAAGNASGGSSGQGGAAPDAAGGSGGQGDGAADVADGPADTCTNASDCPGGACWQKLDGARACVAPRTAAALESCAAAGVACCTKDADCTEHPAARCLRLLDVVENFCGGAAPQGNACRYDVCKTDDDCKAAAPAGATVATCLPSGALNTWFATCAYGACRTDADCTLHPGGQCQYGQAATNGMCNLHNVLY